MVNIRFNPNSSGILLDVKLTGDERSAVVKMLLDTGATYCVIPFEILSFLGYEPADGKEKINITTASGVEIMPLITLKRMSTLSKSAENVKVACHDLPPSSRVEGLLGLSYLKHFKLTIDFVNGILEME